MGATAAMGAIAPMGRSYIMPLRVPESRPASGTSPV